MATNSVPNGTGPDPARRSAAEVTLGRVAVDVAAGLLLPVVCLVYDPIVFRGDFGEPFLARYAVFAHCLMGVSMLALSLWLPFRRCADLFVGFLAAGAVFALLLGIALLPLSLIALPFGVLGLSPFLTAFVYARNTAHAWAVARERGGPVRPLALGAVGLLAAFVGPWAAQVEVRGLILRVGSADAAESARAVETLRRLGPLVDLGLRADLDPLVVAYEAEADPERRARLAAAYRQITGTDIEHRLAILTD